MTTARGQPGEAQPEVLEEAGVFGGKDGLAQLQRDVVVAQHHATLDREFADHGVVAAEHAGDGVRGVVVERGDGRQVVGVGEQHAARRPEQRRDDEERRQAGMAGERGQGGHDGAMALAIVTLATPAAAARTSGRAGAA